MHHSDVDWDAVERSAEFRELIRRKRAFVVPATAFFMAWFIAFILLSGYAQDFMAESVYEGLTVGYCLALSQFLMVWALSWLYLRKATREFDPLRERALARAREHTRQPGAEPTSSGRFARPPAEEPDAPPAPTTTPAGGGS